MHGWRLSLAVLVTLCSVEAIHAQSLGHRKIPSTPAQFFNVGFGAGHHAPIVHAAGCHPPQVLRGVVVPRRCSKSRVPSCGHGCRQGGYGASFAPAYVQPTPAPQYRQRSIMQPKQTLFQPPSRAIAPIYDVKRTKLLDEEQGRLLELPMPEVDSVEDSDDVQAFYGF